MTLMTFQPAPRKVPSSSSMMRLLPRTGPSSRCRLQLTTKIRLSSFSREPRRDGAEGVDLVGLAVADEGPDLAVGLLDEAAVLQVLHEARLVDGVERADAHGDGGELPEVLHQPGVRVAGEAGLAAQFVAEVLEAGVVEAAFEEGAGVDAGRGVALEVDEVAGLVALGAGILGVEEVVEADFEQRGERGVGGDVAADAGVLLVLACAPSPWRSSG